jgi:RNA-directed DNA polymerase
MNATTTMIACASSDMEMRWHSLDWARCHQNVRRLQARIVKATKEGRWGKVKSLQWLLTHSLSGKALAVKQVTENQGKKTPGVDGKTWSTPEAKMVGLTSLKRHGYRPQPLRRVYIPKSNGGQRPLGIPTLKDRAMQALYRMALDPVAETTGDKNSYGFRMSRSAADAMEKIHTFLAWGRSATWILEGDIKGCFDNISHDWMLANIPMDKAILKAWLKCGFVEAGRWFDTTSGTPQGGVISPTLANMVLDGMEKLIERTVPSTTRKGKAAKINFIRYADDFIITGATKELLENEIKPAIEQFMAERGLRLSEEKTVISHIDDGFDFLGFNVRKYDGKLLIKPGKKQVQRFLDKVRAVIDSKKTAKQINLIGLLNPIIRGWANYYRHKVSSETFGKVDHAIWSMLWQWAKRRHPKKGLKWIKEKYFRSQGQQNWVFAATSEETGKTLTLYKASETRIVRHKAIKGDANPYDPKWEVYFETRLDFKTLNSIQGRGRLINIWLSQDCNCPICKEPITKETGWNLHHVVWRSRGGEDKRNNLVMLHPNCHRQFHANEEAELLVPLRNGA